jgi:hypothetical protein
MRFLPVLACVVCGLGAAGQVYGDSTCEAVLAEGGISLRSAAGEPLWKKPFLNRWLVSGTQVQASPDCRWVVAAGSASYQGVVAHLCRRFRCK